MSYQSLNARFIPLEVWPGERTKIREKARFKATVGKTVELLRRELAHVGARNVVIHLECDESQIRNDGYPRADARCGPGVIVSFECRHGPLTYPCDTFQGWWNNLRAIALTMEHLRAVERFRVAKRGEQYSGWKKVGAGRVDTAFSLDAAIAFYIRVGGGDERRIRTDRDHAAEVYRRAVKACHPDHHGPAFTADFQRLQEAKRVIDMHHGVR